MGNVTFTWFTLYIATLANLIYPMSESHVQDYADTVHTKTEGIGLCRDELVSIRNKDSADFFGSIQFILQLETRQ